MSDLQLKRWLKDGEPLAKSDGDGQGLDVRELIKDYKTKVLVTLAKSTKTCYTRHHACGKRLINVNPCVGIRSLPCWVRDRLDRAASAEGEPLHAARPAQHDEVGHARARHTRDISEMCLNQKLTGVEGIDNQHTYYPERRQALLTWMEFLMACEVGEKAIVVDELELAT